GIPDADNFDDPRCVINAVVNQKPRPVEDPPYVTALAHRRTHVRHRTRRKRPINQRITQSSSCSRVFLCKETNDMAQIAIRMRREDYFVTHPWMFWRTSSTESFGSVFSEWSPSSMAASISGVSSGMSRALSQS